MRYYGTWKGITVFITKEERAELLRRFDVRNATSKGHFHMISVPCVLCRKYMEEGCVSCPLNVFAQFAEYETSRNGCMTLMKQIMGVENWCLFDVNTEHIMWFDSQDEESRKVLNQMHRMLSKVRLTWKGWKMGIRPVKIK